MSYILGIETSCDDTAASVMTSDGKVLSNVLSSQNEFHARYGGIVPEIASRKHLELISLVVKDALDRAGISLDQLSLLAVTYGPGLVGSLLIGVDYVKTLSLALNKPFVGVNHLEGHLLSPLLEHPEIEFPFLGVIVSGGHTLFVLVSDFGVYQKVAETIDDACGEALDKFGKLLFLIRLVP
jgi:N6-L-threonylcarbamoyladenine synthase